MNATCRDSVQCWNTFQHKSKNPSWDYPAALGVNSKQEWNLRRKLMHCKESSVRIALPLRFHGD